MTEDNNRLDQTVPKRLFKPSTVDQLRVRSIQNFYKVDDHLNVFLQERVRWERLKRYRSFSHL